MASVKATAQQAGQWPDHHGDAPMGEVARNSTNVQPDVQLSVEGIQAESNHAADLSSGNGRGQKDQGSQGETPAIPLKLTARNREAQKRFRDRQKVDSEPSQRACISPITVCLQQS